MALKPCRECGHEVSSKAKTCPNCGIKKPGRRTYSAKSVLVASIFVVGFLVWASSDVEPPPAEPVNVSAPSAPAVLEAHRSAINEWLTGWSTAQAASVRETCVAEPGCDPDEYLPSARPATTYGWDGASRIEPTADWAEGPRYNVLANGRDALVYLREGQVVSVYSTVGGTRRNICRDEACWPS